MHGYDAIRDLQSIGSEFAILCLFCLTENSALGYAILRCCIETKRASNDPKQLVDECGAEPLWYAAQADSLSKMGHADWTPLLIGMKTAQRASAAQTE
jgi:hypothetical protein